MYHQILLMLADGQKHTAEQLIKQLALSAAALEQAINTLTAYGVRLHLLGANTYQLKDALELLDKSRILAALPTKTTERLADIEILEVIDSTNRYALAQPQKAVPLACLAEYQTAGRGRQGRQWISPYASGLCLSIKHRYAGSHHSLAGLNIALAVTVVRVLQSLGAIEVGLKWPNDVLWRGRKLAGLLLESRLTQDCEVVIGIGINVKMPSVDARTIVAQKNAITQPWVDLCTVLGQTISRNTLAAMLIDQCLQTLITYPQIGLAAFQAEWHRVDLSYGQPVTLEIPSKGETAAEKHFNNKALVTGTAWGIDEQGALLLQVGNQKRRYVYGEVSLRL
ncbi:MAG TPA: biotin--[acetyl-CoA-carboxylase] ligase [Thioploca sp.]|nr:MAG: biotin--[acetyl-CoA-carboxylase] ligase [Gammaproteobacteria bacterium]HDN26565.1 biotin--[acetyl-CoA-carboxylase] ligase [Thioploca sp.]